MSHNQSFDNVAQAFTFHERMAIQKDEKKKRKLEKAKEYIKQDLDADAEEQKKKKAEAIANIKKKMTQTLDF